MVTTVLGCTIPAGVVAGQQLIAESPYGGKVRVVVPAGVTAGQQLRVRVPIPGG